MLISYISFISFNRLGVVHNLLIIQAGFGKVNKNRKEVVSYDMDLYKTLNNNKYINARSLYIICCQ